MFERGSVKSKGMKAETEKTNQSTARRLFEILTHDSRPNTVKLAGRRFLQLLEAGDFDGADAVIDHLLNAASGKPVYYHVDKRSGESYFRPYCNRGQIAAARFIIDLLCRASEFFNVK